MKRKSLYAKALMLFSAMACTVAWTSCSNSDWVVDADPTPDAEAGMVKLSINAYMSDPTGTRAGLDDNTFVAGDTIGLYITKEWGQSPYSDEATSYNVPAVFDGTNWTILKDVYLTEEDASISAYYPYNKDFGNKYPSWEEGEQLIFDLQQVENGGPNLLTGYFREDYVDSSNPVASLYFRHALSRVTFSISVSEAFEGATLSAITLNSKQYYLRRNAQMVLDGWELYIVKNDTTNQVRLECKEALSTKDTTNIDFMLYNYYNSSSHPDTLTVSFTIDGENYEIALPQGTQWYTGNHYTIPVSLVNYKIQEDLNGHEAVDLGLSVKWASVNIDLSQENKEATAPEAYGGYYAWADPTGASTSDNEDDFPSATPPESISGTEYDIARVQWGGTWRLPTHDEVTELCDNCSVRERTINDNVCYEIIGPNGNSIILPFTGFQSSYSNSYLYNTNTYYWASDSYFRDSTGWTARTLRLSDGDIQHNWVCSRIYRMPVRPVTD